MNNELYYNKYLFQQSGGRNIPVSTYDQMGGEDDDIKSKTAREAIGNLATTAKDSAVGIGTLLMENGTKVGANLLTDAIEMGSEAIGIDPDESVDKAKEKLVEKATHGAQVLEATVGDPEFQKALKDGTKSVTDMTKKIVENAKPAVDEITTKVLETTEKVSGKVAQQGTLALRGFASDAASAIPVAGPMIALANTADATLSQGLPALKDAISAGSEIVSTAANTAGVNAKVLDIGINGPTGLKEVGKSLIGVMDRISNTIASGTAVVEKSVKTPDITPVEKPDISSVKKPDTTSTEKPDTTSTEKPDTTSTEKPKTTPTKKQKGGKKSRKRKKRKKTRRKRRKRNKSKKGRKSRKTN